MKLNDNLGRPRYVDRHLTQAHRHGTRRQRRAYARIMRIIRKYGLKTT
jgi:hypothetical protein